VTAVLGGRDAPRQVPRCVRLDVDDCVMFTDRPAAQGWRVVNVKPPNPRLEARRIKTLALDLVEADTVLWIDGRIMIRDRPIRPLLERVLADAEIAAYPHPWRDCAYAEAEECARLKRAPADALFRQTAAYRAAGLPRNWGLRNTMVLARRNTPAMRELGRAWWQEIQTHTVRDQVSLPYLLWRSGVQCPTMGPDLYSANGKTHFVRGMHARRGI
jgi:hypothetical protein